MKLECLAQPFELKPTQLPEALELNLYPVYHHTHALELALELALDFFTKASIPPHALDALHALSDHVPRPLHTFPCPLHLDTSSLLEVDGSTLLSWLTGKDWAPQTVRSWKVVLKGFYKWATRAGLIDTDPSDALEDLRPSSKGVRRHHWLTEDQVKAVIGSCPNSLHGHRDRVILAIGLLVGLRSAEINRLNWTDIDFQEGRIHVHGKGEKHATVDTF